LEQYNILCKRFESGAAPYKFEEFLDLVDLIRKPFVCQIDGHEVLLTQDDTTIMMETSAVKAITHSLFAGKEKQKSESQGSNNLQPQNKRQNCGNPTVQTECGATGIVALHQTAARNSRLNKQTIKKAKDRLDRESKNISTTLTSLAALKHKKPHTYWEFSLRSSQQELSMILRLLAPDSGVISKSKQEQWRYIEDKLSPVISQAAVDAKAEEYTRRVATIAAELATLVEQEQDAAGLAEESCDQPENNEEQPAGQPDGGSVPMASSD